MHRLQLVGSNGGKDWVEMKHLTSSSLLNPFYNVPNLKTRLTILIDKMMIETNRNYWNRTMSD